MGIGKEEVLVPVCGKALYKVSILKLQRVIFTVIKALQRRLRGFYLQVCNIDAARIILGNQAFHVESRNLIITLPGHAV